MPLKRRAAAAAREDNEASDAESERPIQRRRLSQADEDVSYGDDLDKESHDNGDQEQMVKDLVRLALATEYTRGQIRRSDISAKVLGTHSRQFKPVFAAAQQHLRQVFGMEMTELPLRDKVTLQQKKAAAKSQAESRKDSSKSQSQSKSSNAWILTTVLPAKYRSPDILGPSSAPTAEVESQYTALCSFMVSIISLSGGSIPEQKLERYLDRANVGESITPFTNSATFNALDKREKLLKKMEKDAFIMKVKETAGGDEVIEYVLGPRGKVEVGEGGVTGMVRAVYGEVDDPEDLERRLKRSFAYLHPISRERAEAVN